MHMALQTTSSLLCQALGCRWRYRANNTTLQRECVRRCGASQSERFMNANDAARLARYLGTEEPSVSERLLAPMARFLERGGIARRTPVEQR